MPTPLPQPETPETITKYPLFSANAKQAKCKIFLAIGYVKEAKTKAPETGAFSTTGRDTNHRLRRTTLIPFYYSDGGKFISLAVQKTIFR